MSTRISKKTSNFEEDPETKYKKGHSLCLRNCSIHKVPDKKNDKKELVVTFIDEKSVDIVHVERLLKTKKLS